jgi:hypothetical protein
MTVTQVTHNVKISGSLRQSYRKFKKREEDNDLLLGHKRLIAKDDSKNAGIIIRGSKVVLQKKKKSK